VIDMDKAKAFNTGDFPDRPGVYLMKNEGGRIIYIGKAKSLKKRVKQYFQGGHDIKTRLLVDRIENIEYIVTQTELEALILECSLIKKHRPRYNILLKDDKSFPYIRVTMEEDYPRLVLARNMKRDGSRYFGPYRNTHQIKQTIDTISRLFGIRTCSKRIKAGAKGTGRPCLNYHIGRCMAPCQGGVDRDQYREIMRRICLFLSHRLEQLISILETEMDRAAANLDFEKAAGIRDRIDVFKSMAEKQKVVTTGMEDQDVIALARSRDSACVQVFFVRGGKLLEREHYFLQDLGEITDSRLMTEFVKRFYSATAFIPKHILLQHDIDERSVIEKWLRQKKGGAVYIKIPQRGDKKRMVEMAADNAAQLVSNLGERLRKEREKAYAALDELYSALGLDEFPFRIEAFDISNIQGVQQVGSMVVFEEGRPKKSDYRRYKLKEGHPPDDYRSMREITGRRYGKTAADGREALPQLVLVDGGRGQVSAVEKELRGLGIDITVCGMVKDQRHRTRGIVKDGREISLDGHKNALRLVSLVQEEAHRFAVSYHRSLRSSGQVRSVLDGIRGIGEKRRKALLKYFGDISKIKEATIEQLASVEGMNAAAAREVYNHFRGQSRPPV
jgi:excinuclease ABC subunit C